MVGGELAGIQVADQLRGSLFSQCRQLCRGAHSRLLRNKRKLGGVRRYSPDSNRIFLHVPLKGLSTVLSHATINH